MTEKSKSLCDADTILIVEDNDINAAVLADIFDKDYRILEARNGRLGLQVLETHRNRICAVLLDVVMPEMDGIEVLYKLKEKGILTQIPVFLITGDPNNTVMREAYGLGVMDVIGKPVIPFIVKRRVETVIELFRARRRLENSVERQQSEIARQAERIAELNWGMIEALATAIEFRSGESGTHVRRIHDITELILKETALGKGYSDEEIRQIALASIMHDVGKIAVGDAILNKPGRLTPEEFEIMKTHTTQGALLLEKIPQMRKHEAFRYAYDIALHHHERWDGRGYPEGLKGSALSVPAQVVSLADVYDALVSKRVYKDAFGFDKAVGMIQNGECGVLNPELLNAFAEIEPQIRALYLNGERAAE